MDLTIFGGQRFGGKKKGCPSERDGPIAERRAREKGSIELAKRSARLQFFPLHL